LRNLKNRKETRCLLIIRGEKGKKGVLGRVTVKEKKKNMKSGMGPKGGKGKENQMLDGSSNA